ncbi:hypothetical protein [Nonomuraea dietziae]|uniref:hypothetical protein n=1 Tax=Nonomuraea dietziae TaxID=65515 RepID=UPI0034246B0C
MTYATTKAWQPSASTQQGFQPASTGQGQQMIPAGVLGSLLGTLFDLFSTQQQQQSGLGLSSTGNRPVSEQGQQMIPADAVGTILDVVFKYGPDVLDSIFSLFSTQQQQQSGLGLSSTGNKPVSEQGQQMIPADAVGTILDVVFKYGPDVLDSIFSLFSTQQQQQSGLGLSSTGNKPMAGQGQQMIPADAVGTILDVVFKYGPDVLDSIFSLFSTQQQQSGLGLSSTGNKPGQGQQMIPADAVNSIAELFKKYPPGLITDCFGYLNRF